MLRHKMNVSQLCITTLKIGIFVFIVLYGNFAQAAPAQIPDIAQMIQNLSKAIPNLLALVTSIAYVLGMFFTIKGIYELKAYGESRAAGSQQHGLSGPLIYLGVGSALFYLPSSIQVALSTFWQSWSPIVYVNELKDPWQDLINSILLIVQLLGVVAFIRGLVLLTHLSSSGQPGTFGRAITHIIGGVLCINMYGFVQAILNTLALGKL